MNATAIETGASSVDAASFIATLFPPDQLGDSVVCIARNLDTGWTHRAWPTSTEGSSYFCVSTVAPGRRGIVSRTKAALRHALVFAIDDVGTKARPPDLEPTYKLTTSIKDGIENQQWGYRLAQPFDVSTEAGADYFDRCLRAAADAGINDPGCRGANRVMRVPGSLHASGHIATITHWAPGRVWSLPQLMEELGLDPDAIEPAAELPAASDKRLDDPIWGWLREKGFATGRFNGDFAQVQCPWSDEHTDGRTESGFSPLDYGRAGRQWVCMHGHCRARTTADFVAWARSQGAPTADFTISPEAKKIIDDLMARPESKNSFFRAGAATVGPASAEPGPVELDWRSLPEQPPDPDFVIPAWLPNQAVTLLAAHGGTGKSYLSLLLGLCIATGRNPFSPEPVDRARVLVYSAEDDSRILQGRLRRYMTRLGINTDQLEGWLAVLDATQSDNVLFASGRDGIGRTTERYAWLKNQIAERAVDVLIVDNLSDVYGGNEIARAEVRAFMSAMKGLAPCTLLLAHVDAASSLAEPGSGKGYSGSTAWNNSARNRWHMYRDKDDAVIIEAAKSNYGPTGARATLRWSDGVFAVTSVQARKATAEESAAVLLRLVRDAIEAGVQVSPSPQSRSSVFNTIKDDAAFPAGLTSRDVAREVARWRTAGLVSIVPVKTDARKTKEVIKITAAGMAACG
jgi:hypothetical protein